MTATKTSSKNPCATWGSCKSDASMLLLKFPVFRPHRGGPRQWPLWWSARLGQHDHGEMPCRRRKIAVPLASFPSPVGPPPGGRIMPGSHRLEGLPAPRDSIRQHVQTQPTSLGPQVVSHRIWPHSTFPPLFPRLLTTRAAQARLLTPHSGVSFGSRDQCSLSNHYAPGNGLGAGLSAKTKFPSSDS